MPNRLIRESCRTSETLDQLSDGAERMFWRLTTVADDFGRFEADSRILLANCFPLKIGTLSTAKVEVWIREMEGAGLIQLYHVNGRAYGCFPTWDRHQQRRAKHSKHPAPDSTCEQMPADASKCLRGTRNEERGTRNEERGTRHEEGDRGNQSAPPSRSRPPGARRVSEGYPTDFLAFWKAYPRKQNKPGALKAWKKAKPHPPLPEILRALEWQAQSEQWRRGVIPHAATYLHQRRWEDEPCEARASPGAALVAYVEQNADDPSIQAMMKPGGRDGE